MNLETMSYEELEQLSYELYRQIHDLKDEARLVARVMDEKRRKELADNPPDPGQVIGG